MAAVTDRLQQLGLSPWRGALADFPRDGFLLYDTPDRCFGLAPDLLLDGYQSLIQASVDNRVVAIWRLLDLEPFVGPLETSLTLGLLQAVPEVLGAYLDLERKADLLGHEPDVDYCQRLIKHLSPARLLEAWNEIQSEFAPGRQSESLIRSEDEAGKDAAFALHRLEQLQTELEAVSFADRQKATELQSLQEQLASLSAEARKQELILYQVREELEHFFSLSRSQASQLERYSQLQRRSQRLLVKLIA